MSVAVRSCVVRLVGFLALSSVLCAVGATEASAVSGVVLRQRQGSTRLTVTLSAAGVFTTVSARIRPGAKPRT